MNFSQALKTVLFAGISWFVTSSCSGQFDTVVNVPPSLLYPTKLSPNTQMNIFESGLVAELTAVGQNIEVNVEGGRIDGAVSTFGDGATLNLTEGEVELIFFNDGSVVNVFGGNLCALSFRTGSQLTVNGGEVFSCVFEGEALLLDGSFQFQAFKNSDVVLVGGNLINGYTQGKYLIQGGTINGSMVVDCPTSQAGITGGEAGPEGVNLTAYAGTMRIAGGDYSNSTISALFGSFELVGGPFFLNGVELVDLPVGVASQVDARSGVLSATLADGSLFEIDFDSPDNTIGDSATVSVIPELVLGDLNGDLFVQLTDVQPFIELLQSGRFQAEADINQDGHIDLLDVAVFVDLLTRG